MKISYKVVKNYKDDIKNVEEVAQDLIMHTAEVEGIEYEGENLSDVFIGEVVSCEPHPDSEKLNCTKVKVQGKELSIVCGAPNVKAGIRVPVAVVGAQLAPDFVIQKTKIRGETSEGMICSEDELGLVKERQAGILILPDDAPLDMCVRDYFSMDDAILEVDNKAINHRPDLFSHIGIIREIYAICGEEFDFNFKDIDFSSHKDLGIKNEIPDEVSRYIGVKVENIENKQSPEYIKEVLKSADCESKWLLVDVSNYALYLYGQPTHCFDADKITGTITIRYAKNGEKFTALNDCEYELCDSDIVIADDAWVIALGGVIGGKDSAVSDSTTSVIIEWAHFDQATVRKTGKRLGVRTDSLNVFEKDIIPEMAKRWVSLIVEELEKTFSSIEITGYSDLYPNKMKEIEIDFDLDFINKLIWADYSEKKVLHILKTLGISEKKWKLSIPFWRKDLHYKADIAEEVARIDGYNNIETTVPRINLGAVIQDNIYKLKKDVRDFFTLRGYYDMYTYSFVNEELMSQVGGDTSGLVEMKNALSEELTHMRGSLIPNLMMSLQKNKHDFKNMKLFEMEKVFSLTWESEISEHYSLAWVITHNSDNAFYEIQNEVSDLLKALNVSKFEFHTPKSTPSFAHSGRTATIIARGKEIGYVGEVHPRIANSFDQNGRIGFFEIHADMLKNEIYAKVKAHDVSEFQMNHFDINFVVDKDTAGRDIKVTIEKTDPTLIQKVELFDIFESEEKLPGKRSLSFKVSIQSLEKTLDDKVKNDLISQIVSRVEKKGGTLR